MAKLKDKVAVITGATSGMALATAKLFVEEGAYVFITGRRQKNLDEAVKAIGRNVTGVQGDAGNLADLDRLYETVKREKGRIDVLFASAGTGEFAPIGEVTEEQFDRTFGVNVRGTLFTVQKALPLFNDGGSIIMNGSIAGSMGFPAFGVYSASKAAVRSFARTWTVDLKARNIRVNVLSPGTIDTPILDGVPEGRHRRVRRAHPPRHHGASRGDRDCGALPRLERFQLRHGERAVRRRRRRADLIGVERTGRDGLGVCFLWRVAGQDSDRTDRADAQVWRTFLATTSVRPWFGRGFGPPTSHVSAISCASDRANSRGWRTFVPSEPRPHGRGHHGSHWHPARRYFAGISEYHSGP